MDNAVIDLSNYNHPGSFEVLEPFFGGNGDAHEEFVANEHSQKASREMKKM